MPGTLPSIPAPPSDQTSLLSWAAVVTTYLRNLRDDRGKLKDEFLEASDKKKRRSGYASLDSTGKIPSDQITSTDLSGFQVTSEKDAASGYAGLDADKGITPGTTPATPGANILYKEGFIRGWVKFNGINGALFDSFNVDSVTDHSTGNFSVVWTTDFGDADYSIVNNCNTNAVGSQFVVREESVSAGAVRLRVTVGITTTSDISRVYVLAIGGQ